METRREVKDVGRRVRIKKRMHDGQSENKVRKVWSPDFCLEEG